VHEKILGGLPAPGRVPIHSLTWASAEQWIRASGGGTTGLSGRYTGSMRLRVDFTSVDSAAAVDGCALHIVALYARRVGCTRRGCFLEGD